MMERKADGCARGGCCWPGHAAAARGRIDCWRERHLLGWLGGRRNIPVDSDGTAVPTGTACLRPALGPCRQACREPTLIRICVSTYLQLGSHDPHHRRPRPTGSLNLEPLDCPQRSHDRVPPRHADRSHRLDGCDNRPVRRCHRRGVQPGPPPAGGSEGTWRTRPKLAVLGPGIPGPVELGCRRRRLNRRPTIRGVVCDESVGLSRPVGTDL